MKLETFFNQFKVKIIDALNGHESNLNLGLQKNVPLALLYNVSIEAETSSYPEGDDRCYYTAELRIAPPAAAPALKGATLKQITPCAR